MKENGLRLSQCMIVKDEEENIGRALSWGKDIVWEQIVVDTGSTDRTVELARSMGARVFCFEWCDDFAAAKNFAISKASGDWIAFLDADEYFPPEDAGKLLPLLRELDRTRYYVMLTSWLQVRKDGSVFAGGCQTRIFKNVPGLLYKNRIHEELALDGKPIIAYTVDATQELAIFHTGYEVDVSRERKKGERNIPLILRELDEQPDNYDMMGYLGDAYFSCDDLEETKVWYYKAIAHMPEQVSEYDVRSAATFWKLMAILSNEGNEAALLEIYGKAVRAIPQESDFDFILGKFFVSRMDFKKASNHLRHSLETLEKYGNVNRGQMVTGELRETWELLAMCYYQIGELVECVKCCSCLLKADPYRMSTLILLLNAFRCDGTMEGAEGTGRITLFLEKLYHMELLKDRIFVLRAAVKAGDVLVEKAVRDLCTESELSCFDASVNK